MQLAVEPGVGARVKAQAQHEKDAEFEAYMAARQPSLLRTAYLISGDRHTAEDLVQTALAKLYLSWDKVHDRQMIDGYVRRIIVNEHNSLWRRAWKKRELATDTLPDHQTVTDRHDDGQRDALWEFVQTLPRKQRAVIVLRYYEDLSEAEIAETLGISVGTVKSQASRALAAMRSRVHDNPVLAQDRAPADRSASDREEER
ncbi:SigE family RNA polymerase sigma factor [Nocardioides iriomotensis]|uniref:SigE family RNA polymerase sigma factor n=1 Tax=Nocardioides iriomotensis TaxID=715784 RepID=A0A4Q5JAM1_9ACTN|nr:SigE family RNA polymerase sigma factor [Nocardioides iriomotensis]RYU15683.1 SigE family RNA polymerase sigma factor [Nocardioides iriomotensis]